MKDMILKCTGIICITIALLSAHQHGINGSMTAAIVAIIAGICGFEVARRRYGTQEQEEAERGTEEKGR